MANSADDSMSRAPSLHEESDVIELTEETGGADGLGDLDFDIPEFKVPTAHAGAPAPVGDEDSDPDSSTQRLTFNTDWKDPNVLSSAPEEDDFIDFADELDTGHDEDFVDDPMATMLVEPDFDDGPATPDFGAEPAPEPAPEPEPEPEPEAPAEDEFDRQQMVRTIQMQAVDRSQIERAMAIERLNLATDLDDHRFSPDVVVSPPRVLTKQWREGSPVKQAARPPQITKPVPKTAPPPPAAARQPTGPQPRAAPPSKPAPAAPAQAAAPAAKPAQPADADMDGLVAELLEENKPKKEQRPRQESTKQAKALGPRDVWFKEVFNEEYFRTIPPGMETQTRREVDFIIKSLSLEQGARILDLACGYGRHSIEIAQRGYELAGLDLSMVMLKRALAAAQRQSLSIKFIHGDMRKLNFEQIFDGCFLWQSSFGYFDDKTNFVVLKGIWRALKPGGRFLLEVLNRDHIVQQMPARSWWEGKDCIFLEEVDFDPTASVLHTKRSFIYEDGKPPLEQNSYIRLYSLHELTNLLHGSGFRVLDVSGEIHHRGRFLGPQNSRIIVLAERK